VGYKAYSISRLVNILAGGIRYPLDAGLKSCSKYFSCKRNLSVRHSLVRDCFTEVFAFLKFNPNLVMLFLTLWD